MSKKKFISKVFFFVLIGLLAITPIFLSSSSETRYFSIIYVLLLPVLLLTMKAPHLHLRRTWSFWLLIIANLVVLLVYLGDWPSVLNIMTFIVSYLSLFYLISKGIEVCGALALQDMVFKYIGWILLIIFAISPVFTLLQWPANAPEYFPWDAIYSDKRLLLITGQNVGHSYAMWLMAFTAAYIMGNRFTKKCHRKGIEMFLVILLFLGLIATKSRLAMIFIGILIMAWFSYRGLIKKRLYAIILLAMPFLYILSILSPSINHKTLELVKNIQNTLPGMRICASSHLQGEAVVYSGRYVLNIMLIDTALEHPWFGVGHSDDRMRFGVTRDGFIAYGEDAVASSESGLRMLAKYGSIYYLLLILFIVTPIFRAFKGYYKDNIFVILTCGIIFLSGMGGSIFENLYGMSGLFTIILLIFHLMQPYQEVRTRRHVSKFKAVDQQLGLQ